jgi:hypothetical protein
MSYVRNYRETVSKTVSKTVSVSYPASQSGGSKSVTVNMLAEIPVEINIDVDTKPFDRSITHCGVHVDLLTTAIVAAETAEIISKEKNSIKVADTIVGGFFSYIRSEISQQVVELSQNIDAQLMHLKELSKSCLAKKNQMKTDYTRISSRYVKTFEDLNSELSNRVFELDNPAFRFMKETDSQKLRMTGNDLVNAVAISGQESSALQSKISASLTKKRALDTLNKAKIFLWQQKNLNGTIQKSMLSGNDSLSIFTPICFIETNNIDNQIDKNVHSASYLSSLKDHVQKNGLVEYFSSSSLTWSKLTPDEQKNISQYFNAELNTNYSNHNQHSIRVREMIQQITNLTTINTLNFQ